MARQLGNDDQIVWQTNVSKVPQSVDVDVSAPTPAGRPRHAAGGGRHQSGTFVFRAPPSLDEAALVNHRTLAPTSGWRRTVHLSTGGRVSPAASRRGRRRAERIDLIRRPIERDYRIAVLSVKGGVGKTTTTLGLGATFAAYRADRVIAVDARPDGGTLAQRAQEKSTATISGLLRDAGISRYSDVRSYTRMATSRLEVLANEPNPAAADVFDEYEYRRTVEAIGKYYTIILTDCGPGIMNGTMSGVLALADALVIVTSPSLDCVRSAATALKWLTLHGYSTLAQDSTLVVNTLGPGRAPIRLNKVYEHFQVRCRSIHDIPFDDHLAEGREFDADRMAARTRDAYVGLAASIAETLPQVTPLRAPYPELQRVAGESR